MGRQLPVAHRDRGGARLVRGLVAVSATMALWLLGAQSARASDTLTRAECVSANEQADPLRKAGKLREARAMLRRCSAQSCPTAVRRDCVAGAEQTDADMPTVAFSVQDQDGNDVAAVKVTLDGQPLTEHLDGKAVDVDPGEHVFRFEAAGQPPVEKRLVMVEGEKNRRERVVVGEPKPVPVAAVPTVAIAPEPPPRRSPRQTTGLVLGGIGLGLLAGGGAAGLVAALEWSAAKNACGGTYPVSCADRGAASSDRSATLAAGAVADVALGVGAVALVTGSVLVLSAPTPTLGRTGGGGRASGARITLFPALSPRSTGAALRGTF